jgi:hypothetical protein
MEQMQPKFKGLAMLTLRTKQRISILRCVSIIPQILCLSLFLVNAVLAEEEFDFEKEFSIQQKSTLDTFPLQQIDQESLSDLAIEGALQVQNQSTTDGKPVHQKLKDENDKNQTKGVLDEAEKDPTKEDEILKYSQIVPNEPQFQPIIYSQPTGRTYTEHQTTTTFRP